MLTRLVDLLLYTMTKTSQAVKKISGFEKNITRFFAYSFLSVPAGLPRCTEITVLPGDDVRVAKKKKKVTYWAGVSHLPVCWGHLSSDASRLF